MGSSSEWFLFSGRSQHRELSDIELWEHRNFFRTVVVIDAVLEDYYKGLCFIYGKTPLAFHIIRDGRAIRFEPTREQPLFAYQYNPGDLQLEYTPFAPSSVDGSSVAADAKPQ